MAQIVGTALGSERLLLVFIDLKDLLQARELHHFADGFAQTVQDEAGSQIAGGFQTSTREAMPELSI